jgi:hypothetical protein
MTKTGFSGSQTPPNTNILRKGLFDFGLFAVFFIFYMGSALLQTPLGKHFATQQILGMPFGLLMSLLIFPVSWIIIFIWFWKGK